MVPSGETKPQTIPSSGEIPLASLNLEQLSLVHQKLQNERERLSDMLCHLRYGKDRFENSAKTTATLKEEGALGKNVLVPLTTSLYVPGRISNVTEVLVSIGTGYHVQKDVASAQRYCESKKDYVQGKIQEVTKAINEKKKLIQQVQSFLVAKQQQEVEAKALPV